MIRAVTYAVLSGLTLASCVRLERWTGARCADGGAWCEDDEQASEDADVVRLDAAHDAALPDGSCGCDAQPSRVECDAGELLVRDGLCVAGHYRGRGELDYRPTAAGACGLFTIYGGKGEGEWQFSVSKVDAAHYSVSANRCTPDPADAGAAASDAGSVIAGMLTIRGILDCASGKLMSTVRGMYRAPSLCTLGTVPESFYYRGTMTADFNVAATAFQNGQLIVREKADLGLSKPPGGEGIWSAVRVGAPLAEDDAQHDCFRDTGFPESDFRDAGP